MRRTLPNWAVALVSFVTALGVSRFADMVSMTGVYNPNTVQRQLQLGGSDPSLRRVDSNQVSYPNSVSVGKDVRAPTVGVVDSIASVAGDEKLPTLTRASPDPLPAPSVPSTAAPQQQPTVSAAASASASPPPEPLRTDIKCHRMEPWGDICVYKKMCFDGESFYFFDKDGRRELGTDRMWSSTCDVIVTAVAAVATSAVDASVPLSAAVCVCCCCCCCCWHRGITTLAVQS